jgi:hypothetical protein
MTERGRPSGYSETMGREVINLMAKGLSLTAAMAALGFHRQTAYDWQDAHPEFSDAVKVGQAKRQLFLERRLLSADQGPVVTSSIFALKNTGTGDWRDKQDHEVVHDVSDPMKEFLERIASNGKRIHGD